MLGDAARPHEGMDSAPRWRCRPTHVILSMGGLSFKMRTRAKEDELFPQQGKEERGTWSARVDRHGRPVVYVEH
jgi:hypothetical protein